MEIIFIIILSLLVFVSINIVIGKSIRRCVILSGSLSILASFMFILLASPDVALAEAVTGSAISTIVLLFAIKNLRVIHVIYNPDDFQYHEIQNIFAKIYSAESYDLQFTSNTEYVSDNLHKYSHLDYYIAKSNKEILFFSRKANQESDKIQQLLVKMTNQEIHEITVLSEIPEDKYEK